MQETLKINQYKNKLKINLYYVIYYKIIYQKHINHFCYFFKIVIKIILLL